MTISKTKIFKILAFAGWKNIENLPGILMHFSHKTLMHFSHKNPVHESH
jgi:hypothetical protein